MLYPTTQSKKDELVLRALFDLALMSLGVLTQFQEPYFENEEWNNFMMERFMNVKDGFASIAKSVQVEFVTVITQLDTKKKCAFPYNKDFTTSQYHRLIINERRVVHYDQCGSEPMNEIYKSFMRQINRCKESFRLRFELKSNPYFDTAIYLHNMFRKNAKKELQNLTMNDLQSDPFLPLYCMVKDMMVSSYGIADKFFGNFKHEAFYNKYIFSAIVFCQCLVEELPNNFALGSIVQIVGRGPEGLGIKRAGMSEEYNKDFDLGIEQQTLQSVFNIPSVHNFYVKVTKIEDRDKLKSAIRMRLYDEEKEKEKE